MLPPGQGRGGWGRLGTEASSLLAGLHTGLHCPFTAPPPASQVPQGPGPSPYPAAGECWLQCCALRATAAPPVKPGAAHGHLPAALTLVSC